MDLFHLDTVCHMAAGPIRIYEKNQAYIWFFLRSAI